MLLLLSGSLAAWLAAASPPPVLSGAEIAARARPAAEQLEAEAFLAEVEQAIATTGGRLADGITVGLSAGPRRAPEGDSTDLALELEAPLLAESAARRSLEAGLDAAAPILRGAARALAEQQVSSAYADAWLAAERVEVRLADVATLERWLDIARRRVEAGAEPAFEAALVEADLAEASAALATARAERQLAWGDLAALAEVPAEPVPLAVPCGAPHDLPSDFASERYERGVLRQAVASRSTLRESLLRLESSRERSRFSLLSSVAREGEEDVARLGVAYRLPRPQENAAIASSLEAAVSAVRREAEIEAATLRARFAAAVELLTALAAEEPSGGIDAALGAVELRLTEGKDRPSQALAIRRQLLAAREAALERRAATERARAELTALTMEIQL